MSLKESTTVETSLSEHEPLGISLHGVHHTDFLSHWPPVALGILGRKKKCFKNLVDRKPTHLITGRASFFQN